ncbi:transcriptional regulator [Bacteroidia bacterium]|nr:transcriptional regulator [Bacteroidia bacterium]GHT63149.1 transcriptional regulator [Bacteroidia bacterium]
MDKDTVSRKIHHGHNVRRLREMLGIKQEVLAESIGISQQSFSRLENQKKWADEMLEKISAEMKIPVDAIKNFNEESAINIISNNFQNGSFIGDVTQYTPTFNLVDKVVELYDQIIIEKNERIALLEKKFLKED